jgi:hypothetical protein
MKTIFSDCAGNPDCNCDKGTQFSNCSGCTLQYSNCCGATYANLTGTDFGTGLQTLQSLTQPTTTTVPATQTTTEKITSALSNLAGIAGGFFGSKTAETATAPAPAERTVPVMVWVALAVLVVLLGVFVAIKLRK